MKPIRTARTNLVFKLPGATRDHDLPIEKCVDAEKRPILCSVWAPDQAEREAIARGVNIELCIWGTGHPPVGLGLEVV